MFFRKIGITLAVATVAAFSMAALTLNASSHGDTAVYSKRQERLVPAGGFRPAAMQTDPAYGNFAPRNG
ncbi:MAG TPA: hypothetical protein PKW21_11620 [Rhabdaerophilum sp.]|nr:hypothetical protein [Rhabdaerophilum sp.]